MNGVKLIRQHSRKLYHIKFPLEGSQKSITPRACEFSLGPFPTSCGTFRAKVG